MSKWLNDTKVAMLEQKLMVLYFVLFSGTNLAISIKAVFGHVDFNNLGPWEIPMMWLEVMAIYGSCMLGFITNTGKKLEKGKLPFEDFDTTITTRQNEKTNIPESDKS